MPCDAFEVYGTVYGFYAKLQVGQCASHASYPVRCTLTIVLFVNRVNRERGCEAADVSAEQLVPSAHVR